MQRRLALPLGVTVAVAGIWVMVCATGAETGPVGVSHGGEETGITGDAVAGRSAEEAVQDVTETGVAETDLERVVVEVGEPVDTARDLVRVLVTRKDTGEPVPGAEVSYYESRTKRYGKMVLSDEAGIVLLPWHEYLLVTGRHGELYG